jgi:hypothetical protein
LPHDDSILTVLERYGLLRICRGLQNAGGRIRRGGQHIPSRNVLSDVGPSSDGWSHVLLGFALSQCRHLALLSLVAAIRE